MATSSSSSTTTSRGPGTLSLLGIAFVILKLTHVIGWSWWWVLLPFYAGLAIFGGVIVLIGVVALLLKSLDARKRAKRRKQATGVMRKVGKYNGQGW